MKYHKECQFSTSIAGHVTAGRGKLNDAGEWEFPCEECREKMSNHIGENERLDRMACKGL